MKTKIIFTILLTCTLHLVPLHIAHAQTSEGTELSFQRIFKTAGYSSVLGAALGAAIIGLSKEPSARLGYIPKGGSLGFILGAVLGSTLSFWPSSHATDQISAKSMGFGAEKTPLYNTGSAAINKSMQFPTISFSLQFDI
jgi:hypothetical protein